MSAVQITDNKRMLTRGGKPFFMLADTVWSVFSNASIEEWAEYLRYRKSQNFNTLQISILPVLHDASNTYTGLYPYELNEEGNWDFYRINDAFFDKAEAMVRMAYELGFVPALALLWNNYVPGTWANKRVPEYTMPKDAVELYTAYAVNRFAAYHPMYYVSGDTAFENEEVNAYFYIAMKKLKELQPEALTALHPVGNFHELPELFMQSELLDLYIYQSGHRLEEQFGTYELAKSFRSKAIVRPIINSEPCYEGHGHGDRYGRFGAFDLRNAFWSSVLSGANAGFTYGAHGVWSWHKEGSDFTSESWSKIPFDRQTALRLQGAWDVGYAKWLFEQYQLHGIEPQQELLLTPYSSIRMAALPSLERIVIYVPYSNHIVLDADFTAYEVTAITLEDRYVHVPDVTVAEGKTRIGMLPSQSDALIIATSRK
ncbi:DUF4038 domain-containing protein [Paenibacillus sp. BC26]|uniref:apiosidase-like domain-containing protein n=1 Tax=Paenibacillus sp. BC26 TaxID=1881032 RepID=UPI0008E63A30|nr:DUF4038 domain-containing protein [Paenibacillus sp. BC26]SFT05377.1 Protein of unknown function [Paenibacillus sp. BC26]